MGKGSELRTLLRSLCHRARSKYAVLWKFRGRNQTLLAWEDCYCVPSDFINSGGFISFSSDISMSCPIEKAVESMSCSIYSVGEGIVGEVALDRKHRRVVSRTNSSKIPEELWPQFQAGIKAVLFVPVPTFGVVQLGFLEIAAEDSTMLTLVQELFSSHRLPGWSLFDSGLNFITFNGRDDLSMDGNSWPSIYDQSTYPDHSTEVSLFSPEVNFCPYDVDQALEEEMMMGPDLGQPLGPSFLQGPAWSLFPSGGVDLGRFFDPVIAEFLESGEATCESSDGTSPSCSDEHVAGSCLSNVKSESGPSLVPLEPDNNKKKTKKETTAGPDMPRPRPRDRQLIQDRIKELRELVPNASKCSIDTLLDRTVKLMQFLESVSTQGEKLRQYTQLKGKKRKHSEGVFAVGGSRECDMLSMAKACPIVVENLDQPGHMLVEVLCDDYSLFLEIAQIIKHLNLTILRGVLETRSHELWAHFIVEGSRGFHRMDILWPLMQLLQQQSDPKPSPL